MKLLQIPLRARLTTPRENYMLAWVMTLTKLSQPIGKFLVDEPQPRLPPLPRRRAA